MADEDDDLDRARRGDRDAFGRLVRRHQRRVYAAALHILGNHSDADDVTQEAFVRAYRGLAAFDGRADFFTWLYRIAVNTALNALRSGKRGAALHQRSAGEVARVLAAVAELSPALRVTLVLATVEELPHKQIAEILQIPEGTVAWRVNEARRLLKLRLAMTEPTSVAR